MLTGVLKLIAAPASEPITLADAKSFLRVPTAYTAEDPLINLMIVSARQRAEAICELALLPQTWEVYFDSFPDGDYWSLSRPLGVRPFHREWLPTPSREAIQLPRPPLASVGFVKYTDPAGAVQTLASNAYNVDAITKPARITPVYGTLWPLTQAVPNAMFVRFTAGYADLTTLLAEASDAILAMQMMISSFYDNRANFVLNASVVPIPHAAELLLMRLRTAMV